MRHLLFYHLVRQEDAGEALPDVQKPVPFQLPLQVVREQ
jgi:hypothetical protein